MLLTVVVLAALALLALIGLQRALEEAVREQAERESPARELADPPQSRSGEEGDPQARIATPERVVPGRRSREGTIA
ncbi:MAG: hypothetical protein GVY21_08640 [Gammaproteobacteria bacterium]|nr:hypothetical protein [Gammaproteobacteria bacterium]